MKGLKENEYVKVVALGNGKFKVTLWRRTRSISSVGKATWYVAGEIERDAADVGNAVLMWIGGAK